ncbi:glucuronyl hydrolase [Sphingobacterium faecium NBRC 15299]|uniref:glycoside hydrolase family 88 protein n=1 Tax=Sphingobacterium faecium TaxID=34087 RepID=UPI000D3950CE|nr:glycoside hydrolase family 88 protein [Sphingobacterium faecium]PTX10830.1 glycosyl hydrolase family 88 [Sphingobacterium faecium]GEM62707.1 glucuronyl hydrolase [Sphingobacterium faecium NBRC 15299]
MNLRNYLILFGIIGFALQGASCQGKRKLVKDRLTLDQAFVNQNLEDAKKQISYLASSVKEADIPTTFQNGKYVNWGSSWWCSGFYPGTVLYLYEYSKDPKLLDEAKRKLKYLEKEKNNKGTHDLGFMLYCSFGNALRLTSDSTSYKYVLSTGAASLATRYKDATKTIRSWDGGKNWDGQSWTYPVIIDNMMNLEFLMEVSKMTGNSSYADIAIKHADATMVNHYRKDYSSYHVVDYNSTDGSIISRKTAQGAFDKSAWSRGQAWGLYGYTMMFRETNDQKYLQQARNIAKFYLNHPNLPQDLIPYWDMDQNKLTTSSKYYNQKDLRDVSTAAVMASALLELAQYTDGGESQLYIVKAEQMLRSLSSKPYKADYKEAGGYILKHSVGSIPHETEVDVPLTYADYYYVEALVRYKRLLDGDPIIKI